MNETHHCDAIGDYCHSRLLPNRGLKTAEWSIEGERGILGRVAWLGKWRCYTFYPANDTTFEHGCLRAIADFCEAKTREHRATGRGGSS